MQELTYTSRCILGHSSLLNANFPSMEMTWEGCWWPSGFGVRSCWRHAQWDGFQSFYCDSQASSPFRAGFLQNRDTAVLKELPQRGRGEGYELRTIPHAWRCQDKIQYFLCCYMLNKNNSGEDKIERNDRQSLLPWVNKKRLYYSTKSLQNKIQKGFTFALKTHVIKFPNIDRLPKRSVGVFFFFFCHFRTSILLMGKHW